MQDSWAGIVKSVTVCRAKIVQAPTTEAVQAPCAEIVQAPKAQRRDRAGGQW